MVVSLFIPELTTRVIVKVNTDGLDSALDVVKSDPILGDIPSLIEDLQNTKTEMENLQEPLGESIANALSSFQESIISSKHYVTGLMSNSVDVSQDGADWLVGNTAASVDGFPYPLAIEKGTRDHWVAPVTYSALHWGGTPGFFSKGHMVSGITADPYVQPSIDDTLYAIDSIVNDVLGGL